MADSEKIEAFADYEPYAHDLPCVTIKSKVYLDALELLKEQQPKTARWEKRTGMMPPEYHGHYWCSNCEWHGRYNEREADYKFCPACGAKMEKQP